MSPAFALNVELDDVAPDRIERQRAFARGILPGPDAPNAETFDDRLAAQGLVEGAPVELRTRAAEGLLTIELAYLGDAYQPPAEIPQTDFGAFPEGGMGLEIIHGARDGVRYLHEAGVNTVRMTRRLA